MRATFFLATAAVALARVNGPVSGVARRRAVAARSSASNPFGGLSARPQRFVQPSRLLAHSWEPAASRRPIGAPCLPSARAVTLGLPSRAVASRFPLQVNDDALIATINSNPGSTWKAGKNAK